MPAVQKFPSPMSCSFVTDPWEHVIAAGIGIAFANGVVQFEAKTAADLEQSIEQAKSAQKRRFIGRCQKHGGEIPLLFSSYAKGAVRCIKCHKSV